MSEAVQPSLSDDQQTARDAVHDAIGAGKPVTVLVGPAGSGKTTLMTTILDDYQRGSRRREVVLVCPTGKAASVLAAKTGRSTSTVHRAIYGGPSEDGEELVFSNPSPPCSPGGLVVCDEASMVGRSLHQDLLAQMPRGAQLLYVGDREQLPPVNQPWGPNFDTPDAALTQVHRQAEGSPILSLATSIRLRQKGWAGWVPGVCEREPGQPVEWLTERIDEDATLLAYTNRTRSSLNKDVRLRLGRKELLEVGDRVVCLLNSKLGMMNGEVATVVDLTRSERSSRRYSGDVWVVGLDNGLKARVNLALLGARVSAFRGWSDNVSDSDDLLHLDYGFCLTVHKSQGSEWKHVGFVPCSGFAWLKRKDPDEARRLAYTAVTRASEHLRIFA